MLQAVVPQVADCADKVELWVSDNASTDSTSDVVEKAKGLGPIHYSRNETNLGLVSNLLKVTTELARGEFVWLLGDDDLLRPKALSRVVAALEANRDLQLINLNFQCTNFAASWPDRALGGYDSPVVDIVNLDLTDHRVQHWYELISARNSMCGQMYVHVVRRKVWQDYWRKRPRQNDFSDSRWSYPHSHMIAETVMNGPSYYIGQPVLTIFSGGQSWWEVRHSVVFKFSGVLRAYQKHGLPKAQVRECEQMVFSNCEPLLVEVLQGKAGSRVRQVISYLRTNWQFAEAWRTLSRASLIAGWPRSYRRLGSLVMRLRRLTRRLRNSIRHRSDRLRSKLFQD
jgi:glycosyltransferase involved in cell wall biosynthesis